MPLDAMFMLSMLGFTIRPGEGLGVGTGDLFIVTGLIATGLRGLEVGVLVMETVELRSFRGATGELTDVLLAAKTTVAGVG